MAGQFTQTIFKTFHSPIPFTSISEIDLVARPQVLEAFLGAADGVVGLAPVYGARRVLTTLAIASTSRVLVVQFPKKKPSQMNGGRALLRDLILCRPDLQKHAFRMDKLAVSLFLDRNVRITRAVDLLSLSTQDRGSLEAIMVALGGEVTIHKESVKELFKHQEAAGTLVSDVAMQAWAACHVASLSFLSNRISKVARIDTDALHITHLSFLAKTLRDADRLDSLKPTRVKNDISQNFNVKNGKLHLSSDRFKTRIMVSRSQTIEVVSTHQGKQHAATRGRATKVDGRAAQITLRGDFHGGHLKVYTIGKEDLTSAETQRANIVLQCLKRTNTFTQQPFVQSIWLPAENPIWPSQKPRRTPSIHFTYRPLNASQTLAVTDILSDRNPITVIQGPPGTGKTSVIAASVTSMMAFPTDRSIWLIAQSNVAVKNIAEKLADVGFFDFKLLVSHDFHFDWHEHLYLKIVQNVIESPEFPTDAVDAHQRMLGCRVILCTLSMITNHRLGFITQQVPVDIVIVDEASQIEVGQYLPLLSRFQPTLRKMVFIGDDKQLAPYGQDDLGDLRSIFEIPHLRNQAIFLDIQYRMPVPIGNFISHHVYNGKLLTKHDVKALSSCRFKDVRDGKEIMVGGSWTNRKEVVATISLARQFHVAGKEYCVITPYDAQRNLLEKELRAAKLPWEKVFCVDSFQGNEADHIILSLVRSEKLGFLKNTRRSNVMLTRCKRSMVIVTSRSFINGVAASSLVGKLALELGQQTWL